MKDFHKKILVLTTGGTIEKTYDEEEGTLYNRETVIRERIESHLRLPYVSLQVLTLMNKDSLDMNDDDRELIYQGLEFNAKLGSPIVVLHGTDTLQNTVEFCHEKRAQKKKPWEVPIIFTGAMRPLGFDRSDALQNVTESICLCQVVDPGLYVSFHSRLFNVPGVRKNKSLRTFESF